VDISKLADTLNADSYLKRKKKEEQKRLQGTFKRIVVLS
jgi:hypothetical protein